MIEERTAQSTGLAEPVAYLMNGHQSSPAGFFTRLAALNALSPNLVDPRGNHDTAEVWVCSMCGTQHDDQSDAKDCCPPEVYRRYRCDNCKSLHRAEEAANSCCPSTMDAQPMNCPICMRLAYSFQIAADCHLHTHPTMTSWGRSKVADDVEAGMPWADAISAHAND